MIQNHKILIVGPSWIGDMLMAQTLFKLIKQCRPKAVLDIMAPPWCLPIASRMPEISATIELPIPHGKLALKQRYKIAKRLRNKGYTQAIVLPNSFKSALIPLWAKIPKRTGWRGEMRYGLLNDLRILNKEKYPLLIQRYAALGTPKDGLLPKELPWPKLTVKQPDLNKEEHKILALCPGAEFGPSKRWPLEYYAEVATKQLEKGWQVWLFGSKKDQPITNTIQTLTNNRCLDLAGKTTILEAIDLLAQADTVITNDSGLMHITAAVNCPNLIAIYGSSSPSYTPPLTKSAHILATNIECRPCFKRTCPLKHHKCMRDITPAQVAQRCQGKPWHL